MTKIILKNGVAWPDPLDPADTEWNMRRGVTADLLPHDLHVAADVIAAYRRLIFLSPEARDGVVQEILANLYLEKAQ